MHPARILAVCLALAASTIAGLAEPALAKSECLPLTDEQVMSLQGASGPVITSSGVAVKVPEAKRIRIGWPKYLVAARVDGDDAVWGVGGFTPVSFEGVVHSLNQPALDASGFGAAAPPGSRAFRLRKRIARLPQYDDVLACLSR